MPLFGAPDVYLPIPYYPNARGFDRGERGVMVLGRLAASATIASAQRDLDAIGRQLADEYPATNAGTGAAVESLRDRTVAGTRASLLIVAAAVALVLLIACANVANLQLARGASRMRELSVRAALGAGRGRIAQQLMTESVVLSLIGGVLGLAIAFALSRALVALVGAQLPVAPTDVRLDGTVLLFALAVSVATGLLFGLAPAWQATRRDLADMLRSRTPAGTSASPVMSPETPSMVRAPRSRSARARTVATNSVSCAAVAVLADASPLTALVAAASDGAACTDEGLRSVRTAIVPRRRRIIVPCRYRDGRVLAMP